MVSSHFSPGDEIGPILDRCTAPMAAIALTAFAQPHDRAQALATGFQEHLIKPVSPYDLVRTLRMLAMPASTPS